MDFYLGFTPKVSEQTITHQQDVLFMGSCFSEHISHQLSELKFSVNSNPFGIVFNPKSIEIALTRIIEKKYFTEEDVFDNQGCWYCLEAHSSIFSFDKNELVDKLNQTINFWNLKLKNARWLAITFGSAFYYQYKISHQAVANCHKLPGSHFDKRLLETSFLVTDYYALFEKLRQFNSQLNFLLTVSPVKHLRDGVEENSLSKAILIQTVHQLVKQYANCFYFPAYELVNDDLRDYRFYEADMAHPNKQAIEYVWQKFSDVYFQKDTRHLNEQLKEINTAKQHRPFNSVGHSFFQFKKVYYAKCLELKKGYPWLDLQKELDYFQTD